MSDARCNRCIVDIHIVQTFPCRGAGETAGCAAVLDGWLMMSSLHLRKMGIQARRYERFHQEEKIQIPVQPMSDVEANLLVVTR
mmetsp:Transcript_18723/g.43483  ORF Transcript_18723/g.43483 Transcript_18723/m.43483 type:complete len:84 (+) Transcript_18723:560-811(+)